VRRASGVRASFARVRGGRVATARGWADRLIPWVLIGAGVALSFVSFVPLAQLLDVVNVAGTVAANSTVSVAVNRTEATYSEVVLQGAPVCGFRVYVLDPQEAETFRQTQSLPSDFLSCRRTQAVYEDPIELLVVENPSLASVPYDVRIEFVGISQPNGLWILPASALLAGGGMIAIRRMLQGGLVRIVDDLSEREALAPPIDRDRPRR